MARETVRILITLVQEIHLKKQYLALSNWDLQEKQEATLKTTENMSQHMKYRNQQFLVIKNLEFQKVRIEISMSK